MHNKRAVNARPPKIRSEAVIAALEALDATGVRWAVLHGEEELATGDVSSDIDLVVDRDPKTVYRALIPRLIEKGLHPIALWPYDLGAVTLFAVPTDLRGRLQLDLVHDPQGHGRYGFKSGRLLARAEVGTRWPRLAHDDYLLYVLRKRTVKGQWGRVADIASQAQSAHLLARAGAIFHPRAARVVHRLLRTHDHDGMPPAAGRCDVAYRVRNATRLAGRLSAPAGFWAHLETDAPEAAQRIYEALANTLPHVHLTQVPKGPRLRQLPWWAREIAPVRWRAGLAISWGERCPRPLPDVVAGPNSTVDIVIEAMAAKVVARMEDIPEGRGTL